LNIKFFILKEKDMTSIYGVYQYFDYDSWQKIQCRQPNTIVLEYPDGTIMAYLVKMFPRNAQLVTIAKLDRRFADPQGRFTFFVDPRYEKMDSAFIEQFDINDAKTIITQATIQGNIRLMDIRTSQDSLLYTLDNDAQIHVWHDRRDDQFKKDHQVIDKEIMCSNGNLIILHL
jgi:hypothetical protein